MKNSTKRRKTTKHSVKKAKRVSANKPAPPEAEFYQVLFRHHDNSEITIQEHCVPAWQVKKCVADYNRTSSILEKQAFARPISIRWTYLDEPASIYSSDKYEVIVVDEAMGEPHRTCVSGVSLAECETAAKAYSDLHSGPMPIYQTVIVPMMADGSSQFEGCSLHD